MDRSFYFAYGSNMLSRRLVERCPSAKAVSTGFVSGYRFDFTKLGQDLSGKAGLRETASGIFAQHDTIYGVLFEISAAELAHLDNVEGVGRGYAREDSLSVNAIANGERYTATTYIATKTSEELRPFDWYKALVVAGAIEHKLPEPWVGMLRSTPAISDPEPARQGRLNALRILKEVGHDR